MSWEWTAQTQGRLAAFLRQQQLLNGEPVLSRVGNGHSNLIYRVDGGARPMILRRPPPPPLAPGSYDVLREARLLTALERTAVPAPKVLATAHAHDVLDVPFYVMSLVEGIVITEHMPAAFDRPDIALKMGESLVDAMATLHGVDWQSVDLQDFGRPDGFNARHLKRMAALMSELGDDLPPEFHDIHQRLQARVPQESGAALIHNDLRIGNVVWDEKVPGRLAGILDWELAAIGEPLLDLAYLLASLPRGGVCRTPVQDLARACLVEGFPDSDALRHRYECVTGIKTDALHWYQALTQWKLAILYRFSQLRGNDPYFADDSHAIRFLAEASHYLASPLN